jgi:phosphate transport system permease protein
MRLQTRKLLDKSFSGMGFFSIFLLTASLVVVLAPIFVRGMGAFLFRATIEFRKFNFEQFERGNPYRIGKEIKNTSSSRQVVYDLIENFEKQIKNGQLSNSDEYERKLIELKKLIKELLGPFPDDPVPVLIRDRYGLTRWEKALSKLNEIMVVESWDYSDPDSMGKKVFVPRINEFSGTSLERLFPNLENNLDNMLLPRLTFYWQFLTDNSFDSHMFGGIWAEVLGTLYLILGTMIFAIPMGVIAAVYLAEFSREGKLVSLLRTFISTLAGVPSIVFGLFGLAFFINTLKISDSKSVLVGSLTLALLVLPTIIRASEEAIKAVPKTYKEAALSLGASKLHMVVTVILPAALPGILTGIVISMGRAAGETAPIIFTAAVSVGKPLKLFETFNQPTPALPWNIYNLVTEHEAVDQIRHVQFGMVFTLVLLVLFLNLAAILLRARISKKLRG